jgi:PAN domain
VLPVLLPAAALPMYVAVALDTRFYGGSFNDFPSDLQWGEDYDLGSMEDVDSTFACAKECRESVACRTFSYDFINKVCYR